MTEPKTLVLVDGHALAYRAFHALKEQGLRTSSGEPTYAVFGFCQILLTALQELRPDAAAVCFDVGRTFRHDQYAAYKANRAETPAEFHTQLQRIKEVLEALNIPIYSLQGYEADDVIGTLATQAARHGVHTVILTGDTDTLQLVNDHVHVLMANPYRGRSETIRYDVEKVRERYKGLEPGQLADLRGLRGDVTDNIPGVKGIGEAGAIQLLSQFGSVEGIYEHLDEVPNRYRKHLEGQQEQARFSRQLAVIECDVPVQLELERARLSDYDRELVVRTFQQLEFRSLLKKLPASSRSLGIDEAVEVPGGSSAPQQLSMFDLGEVPHVRQAPLVQGEIVALGDYHAVTDEPALDELVRRLAAAPGFAFDTEGTGLDPRQAELCGIAIAVEPGSGWYVPVGHRTAEEQLPLELVLHRLRPFFSDPNKQRIAHNAKFDIEMLEQAGMPVPSISFDTMIAAALLGRQSLGLKDLAFNELSIEMTNIEELIGRGKTQTTMDLVPVERVTPYACADVDMTLRLAQRYEAELADQPRVAQIFRRMELPLVPVLVAMEQAGIGLDVPYLAQFGLRLGERLADTEQQIYQLAEYPFNINSGQQLADVLFGKLGLDPAGLERTKTGRYSLTAAALETMRDKHDIIKLILEHRQLTKLKSTYVDALPALVNPQTGRVHTSFNQVGAATGRLSSSNPNLQNIPIRSEVGREIRRAFVAAPGHHLLSADYSQVELRVLAHVTQDPNLIEAFRQDMDIHAATAARLFGVEPGQVDKNQRRIAKCVARGTLVTTDQGLVPIEQLGAAEPSATTRIDRLVAQEGMRRAEAVGFYNGGVQQTIRITTERGYVLEATPQHRVRTIDSAGSYVWVHLEALSAGMHVALARGTMLFGEDRPFDLSYARRQDKKYRLPERITPPFARFLGYFVAEGNYTHGQTSSSVVISNSDPEVLQDLRGISIEVFGAAPHELVDHNGVTSMRWHCSRLADLLEYLGVQSGAGNKTVPSRVMQGSYECVTEFLRGFFEGDGSISDSDLTCASKSYTLIQQVKLLLLNLGIVTRLEHRDIEKHGRHYKLYIIGRESREAFARHVGFVSRRKADRLKVLLEHTVTNEAIYIPAQVERLRRLYNQARGEHKETIHTCIRTKSRTVNLTYRRLAKILAGFASSTDPDVIALREHYERNLFYDRIVSIEQHTQQVYDLVVPSTNTYIANGFVSHNTIVFGVIYGISSFGLAPRIERSRSEAQALIDALFAQFPGIRDYINATLEEARDRGYVHTLFGRRRYFPELMGGGGGPRKQAAEREAINAPIQGTSADLVKLAMVRLYNELCERRLRSRILLQVHDELLLEVPEEELQPVQALVREVMEHVYPDLRVPLKVDIEHGPSWAEMEEVAGTDG